MCDNRLFLLNGANIIEGPKHRLLVLIGGYCQIRVGFRSALDPQRLESTLLISDHERLPTLVEVSLALHRPEPGLLLRMYPFHPIGFVLRQVVVSHFTVSAKKHLLMPRNKLYIFNRFHRLLLRR